MTIQWLRSPTGGKRLHISGVLDFTRRSDFMATIRESLDGYTASLVEVDLSGVSRIDSTGLGLLLILNKQAAEAGRQVALQNCSRAAKSVLNLAGFKKFFAIS